MNQIDHVRFQIKQALTHTSAQETTAHMGLPSSRWGYIDNDWQLDQDRQAVLAAALEFELVSTERGHPETWWSERTLTRFDTETHVLAHTSRNDEFSRRAMICRIIHKTLVADGYVLSDFVNSEHAKGCQWLVRYSKIDPQNPAYCFQIRVVFVPHEFVEEDFANMVKVVDLEAGEHEYYIVNYEQGVIGNVDVHSEATGQLLRRITVEAIAPSMVLTYLESGTREGCKIVHPLGRIGFTSHRQEDMPGGTRYVVTYVQEDRMEGLHHRQAIVECFDKQNTAIPASM